MTKIYHIYAYKHFWVENDPMPVPYTKDERMFDIEAESEKEAIAIAEKEYGSGERYDQNGQYKKNDDGSWTLMGCSGITIGKEK